MGIQQHTPMWGPGLPAHKCTDSSCSPVLAVTIRSIEMQRVGGHSIGPERRFSVMGPCTHTDIKLGTVVLSLQLLHLDMNGTACKGMHSTPAWTPRIREELWWCHHTSTNILPAISSDPGTFWLTISVGFIILGGWVSYQDGWMDEINLLKAACLCFVLCVI